MAGINDRVRGFLDSWPLIRENLEEVIEDGDKGMVELKGGLQAFGNLPPNSLQAFEGKIPAASTSIEGDLEIQPD
jgi:hypothetical protein